MKERKPDVNRKENTKGMPRKEKVAISRLKTGYRNRKGLAIHYGPPVAPIYPSTT
jgi:hypothetical protein